MKDTASGVGMDPGEIFNLAGLQSQNDIGLELGRDEADAIREAGYYGAAGDMLGDSVGTGIDWAFKAALEKLGFTD